MKTLIRIVLTLLPTFGLVLVLNSTYNYPVPVPVPEPLEKVERVIERTEIVLVFVEEEETHLRRSLTSSIRYYTKNDESAMLYAKLIESAYKQNNIDPWLVFAIIAKESSFRPTVSSYVGAQGLMQVMPFWKKEIGNLNDDLLDPETNINYGVSIYKRYLKKYKSRSNALAAYNGSKGSLKYPLAVNSIYVKHVDKFINSRI